MSRLLVALGLVLGTVTPALADTKICVVDLEESVNKTKEGVAATQRLESMYASKQAEIERKGRELEKEFEDYDARKMVLNEDARKVTEQALWEKQQAFQGFVRDAETEMQDTYATLLAGMEEKIMGVAKTLGASKGCALVLQKAAVIYAGTGVTDLSADLVKAYDEKYK